MKRPTRDLDAEMKAHRKRMESRMINTSTNTDTSGGTRYSEGKPAGWWYAPLAGLKLVAPVWEMGARKYAPMDWRQGQNFSTLIDCAMRHSMAIMQEGPWARDPESGHYHAGHVAWNWLALLTFMALDRRDLDDITPYQGVNAETFHAARAEAEGAGIPTHEVLRGDNA